MAFTVSIERGMHDYEFEAIARQMARIGLSIADGQRVLDPVTRRRWLPALGSEAEAERFASALREETESDEWRVYELPGVEPSRGPFGPIDIRVARRSDGAVYGLSSMSEGLVQKSFPQAVTADIVKIRIPTESDFEKTQGPYWGYIAKMLTGLSDQQIEHLGGYRIIDEKTQQIYRDVPLSSPTSNGSPVRPTEGAKAKRRRGTVGG